MKLSLAVFLTLYAAALGMSPSRHFRPSTPARENWPMRETRKTLTTSQLRQPPVVPAPVPTATTSVPASAIASAQLPGSAPIARACVGATSPRLSHPHARLHAVTSATGAAQTLLPASTARRRASVQSRLPSRLVATRAGSPAIARAPHPRRAAIAGGTANEPRRCRNRPAEMVAGPPATGRTRSLRPARIAGGPASALLPPRPRLVVRRRRPRVLSLLAPIIAVPPASAKGLARRLARPAAPTASAKLHPASLARTRRASTRAVPSATSTAWAFRLALSARPSATKELQ
jgi:hypothetical protein